MNITERLDKLPTWFLNLVFLILLVIPMFQPIGLPIQINEMTRGAYRTIEELPEGSVAIIDYSVGPANILDLASGADAMIYHMFKRNFKLIFISSAADGPMFVEKYPVNVAEKLGKVYGIDYVHLGYFAGAEMGIAAVMNDIGTEYENDYHGTSLNEISLTQEVKNHEQINLAIYIGGGADTMISWIRQVNTPYNIPVVQVVGGTMIAQVTPYFPTQVSGILASLQGSAEYELLVKRPGKAIGGMDSLSLVYGAFILFVLLGNINQIKALLSKGVRK